MRSRHGPERRPLPDWGFDPAAARDDNDARDYYCDRRPDLADAFEADFGRAVDLIRAHPESSPVLCRLSRVSVRSREWSQRPIRGRAT